MKSYTLKFNKADFISTSFNLWRTPIIDLYDNSQYKNYTVRRSNYGTNLLGNGVYTGMDRRSSTTSEIGHVSGNRFIDTSSTTDILAWNYDATQIKPDTSLAAPLVTLNVYSSDESDRPLENVSPGGWANQQNVELKSDIYMLDCGRYAYFELDFERGALTDAEYATFLDNFTITLYIRVEIDSPTIDAFFSRSALMMNMFPQWMDINEYSLNAALVTGQSATPMSLGGKFLNALAGEWLNDIQSKINYQTSQHYIDTVDISQKAWVYRVTDIGGYIQTITGDVGVAATPNIIALAATSNIEEFHQSVDADNAYFWNKRQDEIFTNTKYSSLLINGKPVYQSIWQIWNAIDDLGATVDIYRHKLESNTSFRARIKDTYINKPGTSVEAFKLALRRELNLWQFEGATPDSYFLGATPEVLEMSDIEKDPSYFTDRGLPTDKFKRLAEELAIKYPMTWGYFRYDQAYWDPDGISREGFDYLPRQFDATPAIEKYLDSGVGDGNDLFLFPPDFIAPQIDFTTKLKVRGRQFSNRTEYQPLTFQLSVYGRADKVIYANPAFSGWFTIEVLVGGVTYFSPVLVSTTSDVNETSATPSTSSLALIEWANTGMIDRAFNNAGHLFYRKTDGAIYVNGSATPNNLISLNNITSVTIKPGRWDTTIAIPAYVDIPTAVNYKLWFDDAPGTVLGSGGSSVSIVKSPYNYLVSTGSFVLQSMLTASSNVIDGFTTQPYNYKITLNDANPSTSPKNFTLDLPRFIFPTTATNTEVILEIISSESGIYGATGGDIAATPMFVPSSLILANDNGTWTGGNIKSVSPITASIVFSTGVSSVYPVQVANWTSFEASLVTPISGVVDKNGPWRDGIKPSDTNTNYVMKYLSLNRASFGLPNSASYIITWIGVDSVSSDDVTVWLNSNTIKPAVTYSGETNLQFEYSNDAIVEINDQGTYTFAPFPLYVKVKQDVNEKWNPKIHSGWFYDDVEEYYLYANPKDVKLDTKPANVEFFATIGNSLSTTDAPALRPSGDITYVFKLASNDWLDDLQTPVAKWSPGFLVYQRGNGTTLTYFTLYVYDSLNVQKGISTVTLSPTTLGLVNGQFTWFALAYDMDDELGGRTVRMSTSQDGVTWTDRGVATVAGVVTTPLTHAAVPLNVGISSPSYGYNGKIGYVSIRNGISGTAIPGGTEFYLFDAETDIINPNATSLVSSSGHTMTVNRNGTPSTTLHLSKGSFEVGQVNRQGAPVIVYGYESAATPHTLRQVSNFIWDDHATPATPSFSLIHSEIVKGNGKNRIYLAYTDIYSLTATNLTLNKAETLVSTSSYDNVAQFVNLTNEDYEYEIKYRVRDSYYVDNNYDSTPSMRVVLDQPSKYPSYGVVYESSTYNPATPIDVPLNTLYTSMEEGFIYIDHDIRPLKMIEVYFSPSRIIADTIDYGLFTIKTVDDVGNPKPYCTVNLYTSFGTLSSATVKTDEAGFASVTLTSELWDGSLTPFPATPSLGTPTYANSYLGQVLAVSSTSMAINSLAQFNIKIPDTMNSNNLVLAAAPITDAIPADGNSALGVVGKVLDGSQQPVRNAQVFWRKGRTVYEALSMVKGGTDATPGSGVRGFAITDSRGRFQLEPLLSAATPGYWFVALESSGYMSASPIYAATPNAFNAIGDIVTWYEYPNVNAALDPITNLSVGTVQQLTNYWQLPNYTSGNRFPVNFDESQRQAVGRGATPQWQPPTWYAIDRYRQYQMGLRGSAYYVVGATPPYPDYKEF